MRLIILITAGFVMASQAETRRIVEQLLMMGEDNADRNARASPVAPQRPLNPQPPLSPAQVRERLLQDPWMQHWMELQRERERTAPYQNENLAPHNLAPADATPYEDPWSGPTLAPDSPKSRDLLRRR